ncbi:hypothetical protein X943_002558 [Babesia divergens]|uniref:Ribosome biogenesis protein SLX9 n=1 Tax=Babesia divergens TaxID=32595 RepID=A0AAD9G909_BABDI|nr:hypothetical protein X943_002558 [Babesia divergens]
MAKLTRIVKKILVKGPPDRDAKKTESALPPGVESLATRGLAQPTVDFSNLPIIDDEELRMRNEERARRKALVAVNRKGSGIAKDRANVPKFKSNVVQSKVKGRKASTDVSAKSPARAVDFSELSRGSGLTPSVSTRGKAASKGADAPSTKVIKSGVKSGSRSKRKREARKEMWRRKYDFQSEAKRLVENFQKEDKHGKALGNLSLLHNEVSSLEEMLKSAPRTEKVSTKASRKHLLRAKLRNKALLQSAMNNA